ncbi:carbohydrate ABC transporter permease [Anaerocolumna xylanovorans]|uniref:Carbohydrate ABC transporter membrane protein 2, CUT1 family n=1 Tax=Anaerocolumna xylanovorans DSM 12503 TaxID=1121345 RepID=A0A1M7YHM8_9FIRM|nr:carbohydrate ABC transporter permease [Anaerocolumna xylanovorans]SHO52132.1 carbohydrate ABC transporter membrane protein 2, CUT1 family [Anaerocolumna xylanovorans DSM 12503]
MIIRESKFSKFLTYTVLSLITLLTLLPLIWMLSASLKLDSEVFSLPIRWIPKNPQWKNYTVIWGKIPFGLFVWNTLKLTLVITVIQIATSSFAAYGFSKINFKGRDFLFFCYVTTIAIPWQVYMLPQYSLMNKFHLVDTHIGYVLLQSFTAFGVFLMRQFYLSIPNDLLEAAKIDGLNDYRIYFRIVLPLSKPSLATLTIFSFVTIWNDFMGPMIYFNTTNLKTIQLGIRMFIGQYSTEYGLIMAASVVALVPVFIIFLAFQRFFVQGIATSGLKG